MHLTWNKKNWASLSAGPAPVGGAPAQQAVAPEAKKKKDCLSLLKFITNLLKDIGKGEYLISEKIILYFFHVGQFF